MNKPQETKQKDDNEKIFNWILGITIVLVFVFSCLFISLYYWQFKEQELTQSQEIFGQFGDYLGGTIGTVATIAAFIATVMIIYLQKKELKETRDELERSGNAQELQAKLFKQQQFETTFFNILELLRSYSKKEPLKINILGENENFNGTLSFSNKWTEQYPLTLLSLLDSVEDFTNDKKERTKYINIVKANLDTRAFLLTILRYKRNFMSNQHQIYYPYPELKNMIEKYALFDFIPRAVIKDFPEFAEKADYDNIIKFFKLSAFGNNNYYLLADRINLEEEHDELVRYATSSYKVVRLAVAENKNTPIEILEQLSQDSEEEVRQAAINTINSLKNQNDENK